MPKSRVSIVNKDLIADGLQSLGLKRGDIVIVHSSLSSFGYVEGGADTVIVALLETQIRCRRQQVHAQRPNPLPN